MRWLDGITDSMDMSLSKLSGDGEGEGNLVCCRTWGRKELHMAEQLNHMVTLTLVRRRKESQRYSEFD